MGQGKSGAWRVGEDGCDPGDSSLSGVGPSRGPGDVFGYVEGRIC